MASTFTARDGRLYLGDYRYSCGETVAVLIGGAWIRGGIEYSHGDNGYTGWYLATGNGWCPLVGGMTARRVEG
jgi:hypothetical protein